MNMSKNQVIMAAIGGVTLVAAAALGYFVFDAYSSKGEAAEECEGSKDSVRRLLRGEVSPDKESELAYKKNADTLSGWTEAALATAAAGDRAVRADINPAAFKQQLVSEARALSELDGGVDGKVVKSGFAFGFPDFVAGDKLPEKDQLPRLQRLWGDVRYLVEKLQSCGVVEIVRIEPAAAAAPDQAKDGEEKPRARRARSAKKEDEGAKPAYTVEQYAVDFRAKPAALVKALNVLATSDRFVVVDSFEFAREGDMIAAALGEGDKAGSAAQQPSSGRRRRKGRPQNGAEQPAAEAGFGENASADASSEKKGIANDPTKEAPFLVKALVSTYDFGTAAKGADSAKAEESTKKEEEE